MSGLEMLITATSRTTAVRNAGQYLRELLRSEPQYRHRWMYYRHDRERDVHQLSVAKVLAAEVRAHPRHDYDFDASHEQFVHVVSRALKPKGTVLSRDTLELFITAFKMTGHHADTLRRQLSGDEHARVVVAQLPPPNDSLLSALPRYKTISLREYHYLGPDGRPLKHRTVRDIRSLVEGLDQYRYTFDTSELAVERISGGRPGSPYELQDNLWAVDIDLPRTLNSGDEHSVEFESRFSYRSTVEPCMRRVAHERFENVALRVEFHPRRLPKRVFWVEWQDYREPDIKVIHEDPVTLDSEHAVYHRLDVLNRAVVGFRWEFGELRADATPAGHEAAGTAWHPGAPAAGIMMGMPAKEPPQRSGPAPRTDRDDASVLSGPSRDDTDVGWGERPEPDDDERLLRDRPPHWDAP
jgi:hypothetical protein